MAIYPAARKRLINPGSNDPRIKPRVGILHVDAGDNASLFDYFNGRSGGIESHFHIPKAGDTEQYRDTHYQADANYRANDFAVSVETQGYGAGEWNAHQLDEIKALMLWCRDVHGIPLKVADRWDGEGWGYHIMHGSPGYWTNVAKSCPGPDRIKQFWDVLVPWMEEQNMPVPEPTDPEEVAAGMRKDVGRTLDAADQLDRMTKRLQVRANKIADEAPDLSPVMRELAGQAQIAERAVRDLRQGLVRARADLVSATGEAGGRSPK